MLTKIHLAIESVCPIQGVSFFGDNKYEIQFDELATNEQRIAAQSIVDSWVEPPEPKLIFALDFLDRFSETTQLAVVAAASQNPEIRLWYDRLLANGSVDLKSPRLIAGLNVMRNAGLMTQNEIDIALT